MSESEVDDEGDDDDDFVPDEEEEGDDDADRDHRWKPWEDNDKEVVDETFRPEGMIEVCNGELKTCFEFVDVGIHNPVTDQIEMLLGSVVRAQPHEREAVVRAIREKLESGWTEEYDGVQLLSSGSGSA